MPRKYLRIFSFFVAVISVGIVSAAIVNPSTSLDVRNWAKEKTSSISKVASSALPKPKTTSQNVGSASVTSTPTLIRTPTPSRTPTKAPTPTPTPYGYTPTPIKTPTANKTPTSTPTPPKTTTPTKTPTPTVKKQCTPQYCPSGFSVDYSTDAALCGCTPNPTPTKTPTKAPTTAPTQQKCTPQYCPSGFSINYSTDGPLCSCTQNPTPTVFKNLTPTLTPQPPTKTPTPTLTKTPTSTPPANSEACKKVGSWYEGKCYLFNQPVSGGYIVCAAGKGAGLSYTHFFKGTSCDVPLTPTPVPRPSSPEKCNGTGFWLKDKCYLPNEPLSDGYIVCAAGTGSKLPYPHTFKGTSCTTPTPTATPTKILTLTPTPTKAKSLSCNVRAGGEVVIVNELGVVVQSCGFYTGCSSNGSTATCQTLTTTPSPTKTPTPTSAFTSAVTPPITPLPSSTPTPFGFTPTPTKAPTISNIPTPSSSIFISTSTPTPPKPTPTKIPVGGGCNAFGLGSSCSQGGCNFQFNGQNGMGWYCSVTAATPTPLPTITPIKAIPVRTPQGGGCNPFSSNCEIGSTCEPQIFGQNGTGFFCKSVVSTPTPTLTANVATTPTITVTEPPEAQVCRIEGCVWRNNSCSCPYATVTPVPTQSTSPESICIANGGTWDSVNKICGSGEGNCTSFGGVFQNGVCVIITPTPVLRQNCTPSETLACENKKMSCSIGTNQKAICESTNNDCNNEALKYAAVGLGGDILGPNDNPQDVVTISTIPETYNADTGKRGNLKVSRSAATALGNLAVYAKKTGYRLYVTDGCRTYQEQEDLHADHVAAGHPDYSAPAGQSEHQSCLAVDMYLVNSGGAMSELPKEMMEVAASEYGIVHPVAEDGPHFFVISGLVSSDDWKGKFASVAQNKQDYIDLNKYIIEKQKACRLK